MYLDPFDVCYFGQKGQTVYSAATATMILLYHTESDGLKEKSEELCESRVWIGYVAGREKPLQLHRVLLRGNISIQMGQSRIISLDLRAQ